MRATIVSIPPSWVRPAGGRGTRIRTGDLEYPKLPRYQTALCPDGWARICAGSIHGSIGASKAPRGRAPKGGAARRGSPEPWVGDAIPGRDPVFLRGSTDHFQYRANR